MLEYDFQHDDDDDDDNFSQIMIKKIENLTACMNCMNQSFHSCKSAVKQFKRKYPNQAIFIINGYCIIYIWFT
jgi:L-lysine 2,3-aminomutase